MRVTGNESQGVLYAHRMLQHRLASNGRFGLPTTDAPVVNEVDKRSESEAVGRSSGGCCLSKHLRMHAECTYLRRTYDALQGRQ